MPTPSSFWQSGIRRAGHSALLLWAALAWALLWPAFASSRAALPQASDSPGPRPDDRLLFDALDLKHTGLEQVDEAVERKDYAAARSALAGYLRQRTTVSWFFDPHKTDRSVTHDRQRADDTVRGKVRVVRYDHTFLGGQIDWTFNATADRDDVKYTGEWTVQLNRMYFWPNLGDTYWATGDERYAQTWVRQLRSWLDQCPVGTPRTWRTLEAGFRMESYWPHAYHRFLHSPSVTDDDLCLYLQSCIDHGRYLRKRHGRGNWLITEMSGLYMVGCLFPELKEAKEWRDFAVATLHEELTKQFLPDGAQSELSPAYHRVSLNTMMDVVGRAELFGRKAELPGDFRVVGEKGYEYLLKMMSPEGRMPCFNDTGEVSVRDVLSRALEHFPERSNFRWAATEGAEGNAPSYVSCALPYAGFFVMRSGWQNDANCLVFDAGPLGTMHAHQDKLSLLVWAYGRQVLYDGGGGVYEAGPWRQYGIDTASHNTALVDWRPQRRDSKNSANRIVDQPIDARWESDSRHDSAVGVYEASYGELGRRPARHVRRVLFLKPDIFLVADQFMALDGRPHDYQVLWHLDSTSTAFDEGQRSVTTTDQGLPNLAVVPLDTAGLQIRVAVGETEPRVLGWRVDKQGQWKRATVVHRKQDDVATFLTLLLPLRPGQSTGLKKIEPAGQTTFKVTLADGRRVVIDHSADRRSPLRATLEQTRQSVKRTRWFTKHRDKDPRTREHP
jgi:hypothetical protein